MLVFDDQRRSNLDHVPVLAGTAHVDALCLERFDKSAGSSRVRRGCAGFDPVDPQVEANPSRRSTPSRSASWRAAAVAGTVEPASDRPGATASGETAVAATPSRSSETTRPPGPVPVMLVRSMPRSSASRRAFGETSSRPPSPRAATPGAGARTAEATGADV